MATASIFRCKAQTHADTRIHDYRNVVQPTKKKKSVTITNVLCKSNKKPLARWYFQFTVVCIENVKLSAQD